MTASEPVVERLRSLGAEIEEYRDPDGEDARAVVFVKLRNWRGTSADIELLEKIPNVTDLCVDASHSRLGDSAVKQLAKVPRIKVLDLARTGITSAALAHLSGAKDLEKLYLLYTDITDADLHALSSLRQQIATSWPPAPKIAANRLQSRMHGQRLEWVLSAAGCPIGCADIASV